MNNDRKLFFLFVYIFKSPDKLVLNNLYYVNISFEVLTLNLEQIYIVTNKIH